MSDKTKRNADDARIDDQMRRDLARQAKEDRNAPRCRCGHGFTDRLIMASHDGQDRVTFYCEDCAPQDLLAAFARAREMPF